MSARRRPGVYPDLRLSDIIAGGSIQLWRNPAGKPFGEKDVWSPFVEWNMPEDIPAAYRKVLDMEAELAARYTFAWDSDFGYLSPDPEHCGTALNVEGEFHLEALNLIGDLPAVIKAFEAVRFNASSIIEDGIRQAAHIFRVRNTATLGLTENELIARAQRLFNDLAQQEYNARRALVEDMPRVLEDSVARALAILRTARLLSPGELLDLLSPVRLAVSMGFITGITGAETIRIMREQLNAPELPPSQSAEDDRRRDARDAKLADHANRRFASVTLSSLAKEYFS